MGDLGFVGILDVSVFFSEGFYTVDICVKDRAWFKAFGAYSFGSGGWPEGSLCRQIYPDPPCTLKQGSGFSGVVVSGYMAPNYR